MSAVSSSLAVSKNALKDGINHSIIRSHFGSSHSGGVQTHLRAMWANFGDKTEEAGLNFIYSLMQDIKFCKQQFQQQDLHVLERLAHPPPLPLKAPPPVTAKVFAGTGPLTAVQVIEHAKQLPVKAPPEFPVKYPPPHCDQGMTAWPDFPPGDL